MRKLKLLFTALSMIVGLQVAWAYSTSNLTDAGWTQVTTTDDLSTAATAGNYFVLIDAGTSNYAVTHSLYLGNRMYYQATVNPCEDAGELWNLESTGTANRYNLRNVSSRRYPGGWDNYMFKTTTETNADCPVTFAVNNGKWTLTRSSDGKEIGPWNNDKAVNTDGTNEPKVSGYENVAANKASGQPGFYIYTMSASDFLSLSINGAASNNGKNVSYLIKNPSFENGETDGWDLADSDAPDRAVRDATSDTYKMSDSQGYRLFNTWWWGNPISQEIADIPNGRYKLKAVVANSSDDTPDNPGKVYLLANDEHEGITCNASASVGVEGSVDVLVTNNSLTIGAVGSNNDEDRSYIENGLWWFKADNFRLYYYGNAISYYAPVSFTTGSSATADTWYSFTVSSAGIYKIAANSETTIHYTQDDSDDADETASATLKGSGSNYYTFLRLAEGTFYFKVNATKTISITEGYAVDDDLTSLLANPDFSTNDLTGWTINTSSGYSSPTVSTDHKDCEFYEKKFDMSQTLTGMKKGTYEVSFQAFQRPGGNSNELLAAYKGGTWTSLATLKTSAERTAVPNIYSADRTTAIYPGTGEEWPYDLSATYNETKYYVPNSMEGARKWFDTEVGSTGVNYYTTTARAICTEDGGSMYFGFEGDLTGTSAAWLIFANFQLKYIDTDVLVDPTASETLIAEAETLAERAMYSTVRNDLQDAINALKSEKTSGDLYAALEAAMTTATASADNYDLLATAITNVTNARKTANEGTGVFQIPTAAGSTLAGAIATAQEVYDGGTVSDVASTVTTLNGAKSTYEGATLNAPDAEKRYVLTLDSKGTLTFITSSTEGGYGMPFMTANASLAQAFMFEATETVNTYKLYFYDLEGNKRYICTRADYGSGGTGTYGIRTATDKSLDIKVVATTSDGVFNMLNTACENKKLGSNGGDFYTDDKYTSWTIAEATQASVSVNINADVKYGTRIFPFTPVLPSGVKAYSCEASEGNVLTLVEVANPAANTPYILEAESGYTGEALTGWGTAATTIYNAGWLTGVYTATTAQDGWYVLQNNGGKVGFYQVDTSVATPTVGACRCYLSIPTGDARVAFFFEDETTGIDAINALTTGSATIYSVDGHQLPALQKGMNIIKTNGKVYKVMVK